MDPELRTNRILRIPLIALNWVGLVTFRDQKYQFLNRIKGYFVILIYAYYNVTQILFLFINRGDINLLAVNGGTVTLYFTLYVKAWASLKHHAEFGEMFWSMHTTMRCIEESDNEEIKEILNYHISRCRRVNSYLQVIMTVTCLGFCCYLTAIYLIFYVPGVPIHPLSADTWFPYAPEDHRLLTCSYLILTLLLDLLLMAQWNSLIISMLIYTTCMLKILQHKLRNRDQFIPKEGDGRHSGKIGPKENYRFIIGCIEDHLAIIKFLEDLKEIISFPMGADFMLFVLIMCGQAYLGTVVPPGFEMIFIVGYFLSILCLALLYYWHADEITEEGQALALAVYESPWMEDETDFKMAALLMIQRAHKAMTLQAGLFPMNLETYVMMLRFTYSAFTVLSQFVGR